MKKTVFYIRHAKSSWTDLSLGDIDRPLNARGLSNAPEMAQFIAKQLTFKEPITFISSPALRAYTTAHHFMDELKYDHGQLIISKPLYYGGEDDYIDCLHGLDEVTTVAMVFGHNPTLEMLSASLRNGYMGEIPTCCVLQCRMDAPWHKASFVAINFEKVYKPKEI
jgi:phosphohistidine phosphatase